MTTNIIEWDLADLYDSNGQGLGPFITGGSLNVVYTITGVGGSYSKTWSAGLASDRNCNAFNSSSTDRINQLFTFLSPSLSDKQFIVVNDPSVSIGNLLLMYPLTTDAMNYSFNMKPQSTATPNKFSTVISSSIWPPNTSTSNLTLSNNIDTSSVPIGTNVGNLKTCNIDTVDFSYSIIGGVDASKFSISGNNLLNTVSLNNFSSYTITIKSTAVGTTDAQYIVSNTFNISVPTIFTKNDNSINSLSITGALTSTDYPAGWTPSDIKKVDVGLGVTSIEGQGMFTGGAFSAADNLTTIIISHTVTSIGAGAFRISGGLTSALSSITFETGSTLTTINGTAFQTTANLTTITIPSSVTTIGAGAFRFSGLTSITFEASSLLTSIGTEVFFACSSLTSIVMPNSVTYIENGTFSYSGLQSIIISKTVTYIGWDSFSNCSLLTSFTFENDSQLTEFGNNAFENASALPSITIPNSVITISVNVFKNCTVLTSVTFEPNCQPTTFDSTAFTSSALATVYMSSNTLSHLNSAFSLSLIFGFNSSFFGATNVTIFSTAPPPPPPPPPPPAPISNRPGPIQYCTSRFARCNITKKTSFSSGNVTIQGTTNARRQSLIVNQSTYRHGAKLLFSNQVLNAYGRKAGGPGGFGASPRNQF